MLGFTHAQGKRLSANEGTRPQKEDYLWTLLCLEISAAARQRGRTPAKNMIRPPSVPAHLAAMHPTPTNTMAMKKARLHDPSAFHDILPVHPATLSDCRQCLGGRAECVSRTRGVVRQRRQWLVCTTDTMLPPALQPSKAVRQQTFMDVA